MAGVEERNRSRLAVALGAIGLGLVIVGLVLVIQHVDETAAKTPRAVAQGAVTADAIRGVLFLVLVLVGIFVVASLAFLRWSRGFRRWIFHKPAPATPSADVWAMHRLPEEADNPPSREGESPGPDDEESQGPGPG